MSDKLLTPMEAAEYLSVSVGTLRRWAKSDRLVPVRVGEKLWRYRPEDLRAIARKQPINNHLSNESENEVC